jgi:microcompartment protein CcmK/EutM
MLADEKKPGALKPGSNTVVAVDGLGAGQNEMVLFVQGSSARKCSGFSAMPIDAAIVGIVDSVAIEGRSAYSAKDTAST